MNPKFKSTGWPARSWIGRNFAYAPAKKIGAHDKVFSSVKSKSCAGTEGIRELSLVSDSRKPVVVVVFRIAWMRLSRLGSRGGAKRDSHGDRVVGGVVADGLRERASAEVR
jgi:hypothetical protein